MRRGIAGLLAVVVTAALTLIGGAGAGAATVPGTTTPIPSIGVHFHGTWADYTDAQRLVVLDKLAAAHVEWVRMDLSWTNFEYNGRGVIAKWYKEQVDFLVDAANQRGIKVLGSMWGVPPWANGGKSWNVPPNDAAEFGRFMGWAAGAYKGRVAAWELWNEPDLDYFFAGADMAKYTAMVKSAYPAIKAGDPGATVVAGAFNRPTTANVGALYANGGKGSFDALALHAYPYPSDAAPEVPASSGGIYDTLHPVRDLMVDKGDGAKGIWITETGWSSHPTASGAPLWQRGVTEQQQGDYLTRAITHLATTQPWIDTFFWYTERNVKTTDIHEANYGLLNYDLSAKPAYTALQSYLAKAGEPAPKPAPQPAPSTTTTTAPAPTTTTTAPKPAPTTTTTTAPAPAPAPTTTTTAPTTPPPPPAPVAPVVAAGPAPAPTSSPLSYRLVARDGRTFGFGESGPLGTTGALPVRAGHGVVAAVAPPSGQGAWVTTSDGSVFATGGAPFHGSAGGVRLNQPIVGMDGTPSGNGYWLVASDGGIFAFGDARFLGSTGGIKLNKPIVGMTATPSGNGYWLVASDGGIFAFGDARFHGSTGSIKLNQPIVGMAPTADGNGYWLVASDGGVFAFGNARFLGSTGSIRLNRPITGMVPTPSGNGYWFVASDGGVFSFGDARFLGSAASTGAEIAGMVAPAR